MNESDPKTLTRDVEASIVPIGDKVTLKQGDTFVQNGTRHRWRNAGNDPAVLFVALLGAERRR